MANETKPPEWIAEAVDALPPSTYIMRRDSMIDHFEEAWKEAKDKEPPPPPCPECERLRRERDDAILERYEALGVKTTEGLTASEWVLRTGKAEKERDAALARAEERRKLLVSLLCAVKEIKGGDSPLWTHADLDDIPDDHSMINDRATYTAVYAADRLDEIERRIDAHLKEPHEPR